jgi:predicted transcriptional regulator
MLKYHPNMENITQALVEAIREQGLSMREVSRRSGLSTYALHHLQKGGDVRLSTLQKLVNALDEPFTFRLDPVE